MSSELNILSEIHQYVLNFCTPKSSQISDSSILRRETSINEINLYALIIFFSLNCLCFTFGSTYTWEIFLSNLLLIFLMALSFFFTLKTKPFLYRYINTFILSISGLVLVTISKANLFVAMAVSFLTPSLILFLYHEKAWAYISFVIQFIVLNMCYMPIFQTALMTPILKDLTQISDLQFTAYNFIYLLNFMVLYFIYSANKPSNPSQTSKGSTRAQIQQSMPIISPHTQSILTSLVSNLDLAQLEDNPTKSKAFINNAKICGNILLSQMNTLLDIETDSSKFEANLSTTKTIDLLERIWEPSCEIIKKKNLFGTLTLHKNFPQFLLMDQQRVFQIVLNILTNSARFTERGNVGVSVSWLDKNTITDDIFEPLPFDEEGGIGETRTNTLARPVGRTQFKDNRVYVIDTHQKRFTEVSLEGYEQEASKKGMMKIVISDTGKGMTEKEAKDIFELYPKSIKNLSQGREIQGFNTWITNQLCQKLGGSMRVYSRPEKGTTYIICLKAEIAAVEAENATTLFSSIKENGAPTTQQKKVRGIVVDNNPYTVDSIKGYLESSRVDVVALVKSAENLIESYEKEFRQGKLVHMITINSHSSLPDSKRICERIRQFESMKNIEPCAILLLADNYLESQLKECMDPAGNAKANFFLRLPNSLGTIQKIVANIQATYVTEQIESFHPRKVLVVDDNPFNLQLLGRILEMNKYEYISADDGEKAVEAYKKNWQDIAIIFMDCQMPVMNGYEATQQIRKFQQSKKIPKVKILGVTGNVGPQYDRECQEAGMNGTVNKPFPADGIKKIVSECLSEYQ